jgi:two-component system, LytTR family, response regulator
MSERPRVLIADDEPLARERLRTLLQQIGAYDVVAECGDGDSTLESVVALRPDVILLDIRMPGLDGLEVAEAIEAMDGPAPAIVFVTAFDEFALHAFDVEATDYVLKPVERERLQRALERAERRHRGDEPPVTPAMRTVLDGMRSGREYPRRFLVRGSQGLYFVHATDVEWADAQGNYARLHAKGRAHLLRSTMKALVRQLDPAQFVRIHRSALVNIDCIERIEPYTHGEYIVALRDGSRLTSSRAHSGALKALLNETR